MCVGCQPKIIKRKFTAKNRKMAINFSLPKIGNIKLLKWAQFYQIRIQRFNEKVQKHSKKT